MTAAALPCFKVALISHIPHLDIIMTTTPYTLTGTMLELLPIISQKLNRCMEYVIPTEPTAGYQLANGTWTSAIGLLSRNEVDMVGVPFVMNDVRAQVLDYSVPLYMDRHVLVYKRPGFESDLTGFVKPYTTLVWLLLLATMVVVCLGTFLIQKGRRLLLTPQPSNGRVTGNIDQGLDPRNSLGSDPRDSLGSDPRDSTLNNVWTSCLWTLTASLAQSSAWWPRGDSVRAITGLWLLMTVILATVYRSNLKAMLILPKLHLPFNSLEEQLLLTDLPCFVPSGNILHHLMLEAPAGSVLQRMLERAVIHFDIAQAIQATMQGKHSGIGSVRSMTFIMHSIFSSTKTCPLYVAEEPVLTVFSQSIAFPKGSPLKHTIDRILRNLRDFGILEHLYNTAVQNGTICLRPDSFSRPNNSLRPLDLGDFFGVFSVYIGGALFAGLVFVVEVLLKGLRHQ